MPGDARRSVAPRPHDTSRGIEHTREDEHEMRALAGLDPHAWTVLSDLRWPGRSFPNVDFVAVGPGGVFVVDSLPDSGVARIRNDRLRIDDRPQDGRVLATATAARTIAEWLPTEYRTRVHPIVCLRRRERFSGTTRGVTVCSTANLQVTLTAPEAWLEPQHVAHVAELIRKRLASADGGADDPVADDGPTPPAEGGAQHTATGVPLQRRPPAETPPPAEPPRAREHRRPPRRSRGALPLFWLVLAISLVMLGLLLALRNPAWLGLG